MKNAQKAEKSTFRAFSFARKNTGRGNDTGPTGNLPENTQYRKNTFAKEKIFFYTVKNFPQQIKNTREIIENMSEII